MGTPRIPALNDMSRVWAMEDGAGPTVAPEYMGVWKCGAVSWDYGESTSVEIPSDSATQQFEEVETMAGAKGKPSTTLTALFQRQLSDMLRMARRECFHDFQVHIGKCGDLKNFNLGWEKVIAFDTARISNYSTEDLGALSSDERAKTNESINIAAQDYYEIGRIAFAEVAASSVIQEVVDMIICDNKSCGACGVTSDGCQKVFGIVKSVGGSPGLGSQVIVSADKGSTWTAYPITALAANEEPLAGACMGDWLIIVSTDGAGHVYVDKDELILGTHTWGEVTTGYEAGGEPRDIFVLKPGYAWVVGAGGYVYSLDDPTNSPVVLDAGAATVQPLNAVHAYDETNVLAVGDANAVIHSTDGVTFGAVTGPAPAVNLTTCWMRSAMEWFVGTAGGRLYYTKNSGATWTEKQFSGSGAGSIYDIVFVNAQVGYMSHSTATPAGRILRTINGGYSWYVLPEATGSSIPANDKINALAVCDDANLVFGGGLADDAADGIIIKGVGS